jgi:hypothetical protein
VLAGGHSVATSRHIIIIIIITKITRFSCLEVDCVFRQAAVKAAKILPLVGRARSKQDPINRGHGAQYLDRPPPAGAKHTHGRSETHTVVNLLCVIEAKLKVGSAIMLHMTRQEMKFEMKFELGVQRWRGRPSSLLWHSPCQLVYASLPPSRDKVLLMG